MTKRSPRVPPTRSKPVHVKKGTIFDLKPGTRGMFLLPFPTGETSIVTLQVMVGRAAANLFGICPFCGAHNRFAGIDHRELGHGEFMHEDNCPTTTHTDANATISHLPLVVEIADINGATKRGET